MDVATPHKGVIESKLGILEHSFRIVHFYDDRHELGRYT